MTDDFGHWFAGFTDGEGCFSILRQLHTKASYYCTFQIALRADDTAILETVQRETGLGKVTIHGPYPSAIKNAKAQVRWRAGSRAEAPRVVEIFEQYPLRSKKARDFEIWKQAVALWLSAKHSNGRFYGTYYEDMEKLRGELRQIREYETLGAVLEPVVRPPSPQKVLFRDGGYCDEATDSGHSSANGLVSYP